jgi:hypothetical protein
MDDTTLIIEIVAKKVGGDGNRVHKCGDRLCVPADMADDTAQLLLERGQAKIVEAEPGPTDGEAIH